MKRKIFSILFTLVLVLSFSLIPAVPAGAVTPPYDRTAAILAAANRLVETQNTDGGFDWVFDNNPAAGSGTNLLGIAAMGILKAHELDDRDTFKTALAKAYKYAVDNPPTWEGGTETTRGVDSWPDITFLMELARAAANDESLLAEINALLQNSGITAGDIANLAETRWNDRLSGWAGGSATLMAQNLRDLRHGQNLDACIPWDLEAAVKAALTLHTYFPDGGYAAQAVEIAEVIYASVDVESFFSSTDNTQAEYVLGLTGAIEAFVEVGLHPEKVTELKPLLIDIQQDDGSWQFYGGATPVDSSVQSTAYAVMALLRQGDNDAVIAARKGADWLVKNQLSEGGWYAEGETGDEYLEMDSEAAWALAIAEAPVTIAGKGYYSIQSAIDAANSGNTVIVAAGTYDELLTIDVHGLTLLGAQADVDPRPTMSEGRSGAEESIIRKTYTTTTDALNPILIEASNVTINGFTISPDYGAGVTGLNKDLVKQEPNSWAGTTIKYNILTATGNDIVNNCDELVQLKGVTGAVIEYNYGYHDIGTDSGGNAFSIADSAGSVIKDNEAHLCGDYQYGKFGGAIYTYNSSNISVSGNKVVGGGGITFGAGWTCDVGTYPPNAGGTVEDNIVEDADFGLEIFADGATVSGNDVTGCAEYALNISGSNITVQDNNLCNSGTGIRVRDKQELITIGVSINYNNIYGNTTFGLNNLAAAEVDATNNWWGDASGPDHATNPDGLGNAVSDNVDFDPWLLAEDGTTFAKTLALKAGWTLVSTDKAVAAEGGDWVGVIGGLAYKYTPTGFVEATPVDLEPLAAIYIKTADGGGVGFNYETVGEPPLLYSKSLEAGWNLISTPSTACAGGILSPLAKVTIGAQQGVGLSTLVSLGDYNQFSGDFYLSTLTDADWVVLNTKTLNPFDGYWAYMNAAKTFEAIPVR